MWLSATVKTARASKHATIDCFAVNCAFSGGRCFARSHSIDGDDDCAVRYCFIWMLRLLWGGVEIFMFSPYWHFVFVLAFIPQGTACFSRIATTIIVVSAAPVADLHLTDCSVGE